ncbi:hypothetical protein GIB67_007326 [Kingdonia uniflora]|uniref:Uncharacterized protein n=1 Tax=Kingdonia uniflora TaxID=39325 RepID=A0A7J7NX81_9MAGN|nr:hypothetical protein GIB67_007326 [Kingdonia uniflora]
MSGAEENWERLVKMFGVEDGMRGNLAWEGYLDASDTDLIVEHQIWSSVDPYAKNEAYNSKCAEFEQGLSLEEMMKDKGKVWDEIVKEKELCLTKIEEVGVWWFGDKMFMADESVLDNMNKSRNTGSWGSGIRLLRLSRGLIR